MMGTNHKIYGVSTALTLLTVTGGTLTVHGFEINLIPAIAFVAVGSVLPDIDVKNNKKRTTWKKFSLLLTLILFASVLINFFLYEFTNSLYLTAVFFLSVLSLILSYTVKHRTYTHALYFPSILLASKMFIYYYFDNMYASIIISILAGINIGYISHILTDMCTVSGVKLLYPINLTFRLLPKKFAVITNESSETMFTYMYVGMCICIIIWRVLL